MTNRKSCRCHGGTVKGGSGSRIGWGGREGRRNEDMWDEWQEITNDHHYLLIFYISSPFRQFSIQRMPKIKTNLDEEEMKKIAIRECHCLGSDKNENHHWPEKKIEEEEEEKWDKNVEETKDGPWALSTALLGSSVEDSVRTEDCVFFFSLFSSWVPPARHWHFHNVNKHRRESTSNDGTWTRKK